MRYVSLFSGIEAASVAWGPLGWEPVAFAEIEPFCCAVLAERFPDVPNLGDVSKIDWREHAGSVDVVVGGSPCQAFSVAGRREGLMDARGRLMLEYVRAVREVRPRWVLWENVPGVLSQSGGDAFETLQRELADCGYSLAWRTLDAQFYRVAQRRRRVFLVGHLGEDAYPAAVLFERESLRWDSASSRKKRKELARSAGRGARGGGGAGSSWSIAGNVCDRDVRQNGGGVSEEIAPTLNTMDRHAVVCGESECLNPWAPQHDRVFTPDSVYQTLYAHGSGGADCGAILDTLAFDTTQITSKANRSNPQWGDPCHTLSAAADPPSAVIAFQGNASGTRGLGEAEGLSPTLRAGAACGNQAPAVAFKYHQGSKAGSVGADTEVSPTLTADYHQPAVACMASTQANAGIEVDMCPTMPARQHKDPPVLFVRATPIRAFAWPWVVRRLMPVECERLQGFPDGWTRVPYRGKPAEECPDTPRYKALGNSMAVPVMRWIGERIAMVEEAAR